MANICDAVEVKKIRQHDILHSHAGMLVELGFFLLLIAENLSNESVYAKMEICKNK